MRHETHTHLEKDEIFEAAKRYFGDAEGGLGMKKSAEQGNQIAFFGNGLVWLTAWPAQPGKETRVDIDVSDRDTEAREFIQKVLKAHNA